MDTFNYCLVKPDNDVYEKSIKDVFDRVSTHLLKQNSRCVDDIGNCVMHWAGKSCAVGCLFTERECLDRGNNGPALVRWFKDDQIKYMLGKLMTLHDKVDPAMWKEALREIGAEYGL